MRMILSGIVWAFKNLYWINILLAIAVIFAQRKKPTTTLLWLMVLLFLPGIGFILFLFLGVDFRKHKKFEAKDNVDFKYAEFLQKEKDELASMSEKFSRERLEPYRELMLLNLNNNYALYYSDNKLEFYDDGNLKFEALFKDIEAAKKYVYVQYYIFNSDDISTRFMDLLIKKAQEGLEVRLLVDGMGCRKMKRRDMKRLKENGVHFAIFFPPFVPYISLRLNYRNHRKIVIIDGEIGYIGGFNVGDEYLGLDKKLGHWNDAHARIEGTATISILWRFYLDWRFATEEKLQLPEIKNLGKGDGDATVQIVSSGPDSYWPSVKDGYIKMMNMANKRIWIETPYFVPDGSMYSALAMAALSGIDVRVMIPINTDHISVFWAGVSYMHDLLPSGVKFYGYKKGFLHSKILISDDYVTSVGSANMDNRSFYLNFEVNAFVYDDAFNKKVAEKFEKDLEDCIPMDEEWFAKVSMFGRMKQSFFRLLSPLL